MQNIYYDLLTAILICLGGPEDKNYTGILKLLDVLLSTKTSPVEKFQILEEEFQIEMTQELESEVSLMCNLSKGVEERGIEKGFERGMEKGFERGIEKGFERGMEKGIQGMVTTLKDLDIPESTILQKLQERFNLTLEEAQGYLNSY